MIRKIVLLGLFAYLGSAQLIAQGVAIGATTPDASAMLEVRSTTKGFLLPKLTTTLRNAIISPATGLQVYNTTTNAPEFYNGTAWQTLGTNYWTSDTYGINYQNTLGGIGLGGSSESAAALAITQKSTGGYSAAAVFKGSDTWHTVLRIDNTSSSSSYQFNLAGSNNTAMVSKSFSLYNATANNFVWITDGTSNSYLGIGSYSGVASVAKSRLHVFNGDVNIDQVGKGIIMKSPNGNCWRVTIDNSGNFVSTAIACP